MYNLNNFDVTRNLARLEGTLKGALRVEAPEGTGGNVTSNNNK
jgi:hypothetical protein